MSSDSAIFDLSLSAGDVESKPFLKKEILFITDQNSSGNYSTSQIIFETSQLSNNGRWCDYGNDAYLSFPLMLTATAVTTAGGQNVDWTAGATRATDFILGLKNSNYNLIHSIQVEYSNTNVVQLTPYINTYLNFKLHSEMSYEDELLNGPTIGYSKDTSTSWRYEPVASVFGRGLCNNANSNVKLESASEFVGEIFNEGMRNRQNNYQRIVHTDLSLMNNREIIYGNDNTAVQKSGVNCIDALANYKVYYYDAILRLKDLPFFGKLPLIRGAYLKITLNVNQCIFNVTKSATGVLDFIPSSLSLQGGTNPLMVSASIVPYAQNISATVADQQVGTIAPIIAASNLLTKFEPCGSANLPQGSTLTASLCIGKNNFPGHSALGLAPLKSQCRLYVPTYTMSPQYEQQYIAMGQKTITYLELFSFPVYNIQAGANFTNLITNGLAKMKRMIVCPFVSASNHGTAADNTGLSFSPFVSPFSTEPSTCSPYLITNWNVNLGGLQLYQQNLTYTYENFLNESNGQYGINSNKTTGLCSSRISQIDFNNTYGYLVSDLSRRLSEDDNTSISVSITGTNAGAKPIDLQIFIEYEKSLVIDVLSGKRLS